MWKDFDRQFLARDREIRDAAVLAAIRRVPRHRFVPEHLRNHAYEDRPLPIGHGQTISQPFIVAYMTEQLKLTSASRVLEVGCGCGYQTAVLAELVARVYAMEIVPELAELATANLRALGYENVEVRQGDGWQGWTEEAPFDAILSACAAPEIPPAWVEQLSDDGGRLILPIEAGIGQKLVLLTRRGSELDEKTLIPVRFVPMIGG